MIKWTCLCCLLTMVGCAAMKEFLGMAATPEAVSTLSSVLPPPWNQVLEWVGIAFGGNKTIQGGAAGIQKLKDSGPGSFIG